MAHLPAVANVAVPPAIVLALVERIRELESEVEAVGRQLQEATTHPDDAEDPDFGEFGVTLEQKRDGDTRIRDHEQVNIWSNEHRSWWRAKASGYTLSRREAGVYTMADAYGRTSHCGPEKCIVFYRARLR